MLQVRHTSSDVFAVCVCGAVLYIRAREDRRPLRHLEYSHAYPMHNIWLPGMPKAPWQNPVGVAGKRNNDDYWLVLPCETQPAGEISACFVPAL